MTNRIVDISSAAAFLKMRNGLLVIEIEGVEKETIPFADLAAVVVSNRQVVFTQGVVTGLAEAGASLITCDEKHHPAAMLLPLVGHHAQAERFVCQAALPLPRKKRWWQAIVRAKIAAQGRTLERLWGRDYGLGPMSSRVASGDPQNVEAQAARRYWMVVFGDSAFHRGEEEDPRNAALNYGYAVLRAAAVRALCASGLHPSFGLHHHSKANSFVLGDDVMEPYRPAVDRVVVELFRAGLTEGLTSATKRSVIEAVTGRYLVESEQRTLFDMLTRTAQSLAGAMADGDPSWKPAPWEFVN
jgi:CRISPR-associated protein Cas1